VLGHQARLRAVLADVEDPDRLPRDAGQAQGRPQDLPPAFPEATVDLYEFRQAAPFGTGTSQKVHTMVLL